MIWPFSQRPKRRIPLGVDIRGSSWWSTKAVGLIDGQASLHAAVFGIAGVGKSKALEGMFHAYLREGTGVTLIDPHGSSAAAIMANLVAAGYFRSPGAYERLWVVDFEEGEYAVPFNPLKLDFASPHETARLLREAMHRAYPELSQGAAIFNNLIDAAAKVLIANGLSLAALHDVLTVKDYRDRLLEKLDDPVVVSYFRNFFDNLGERERAVQAGSTIRRAYDLNSSPVLRWSLGAPDNVLQFREILDSGRSVIFNLGKLRDLDTRRLLGSLIMHGYEMAAMSRDPSNPGPEHRLIVDEAGLFMAQSAATFSEILDQLRKYRLFMTTAFQSLAQAPPRFAGALGNCRVKMVFRISRADAELLARELGEIDPYRVKAEAASPTSNPTFMDASFQWEEWMRALTTLKVRQALVQIDDQPTVLMKTAEIPELQVDEGEIQEARAEYRRRVQQRVSEIQLPTPAGQAEAPRVARAVPLERERGL